MKRELSAEGAACRSPVTTAAAPEAPPSDEHLAWELSRCAPTLSPHEVPLLRRLIVSILGSLRTGDTRMPLPTDAADPGAMAGRIATLPDGDPLLAIFGRPGAATPFISLRGSVGSERAYSAEEAIAQQVASLLAETHPKELAARSPDLDETRALSPLRLTDTQSTAVQAALVRRLLVITGGPGTGKTSIVAALLAELTRAGHEKGAVALAAPTGKAAFRLSESLGTARAETLHRLLGYSPRTHLFARGKGDPIDAQVVIVDEASMIDAELMRRLVSALRPDARLILLGDADQLPSVAPGAPFRDLVRALPPGFVVRLTESHRMKAASKEGGAILSFSSSIRDGGAAALERAEVRRAASELQFRGVEFLPVPFRSVQGDVLRAWQSRLPKAALPLFSPPFDHAETAALSQLWARAHSQRILSVTREPSMATSASRVNDALASEGAVRHPGVNGPFAPGDPIVFTRNDYRLDLFNGDDGVVVAGRSSERILYAVFRREGGFVAHELSSVARDIELSYATTVHRAQGGEFEDVLLLLPERETSLLTRELIYTAVTRARRSVVVVGDPAMFDEAVRRTLERTTWLESLLAMGAEPRRA